MDNDWLGFVCCNKPLVAARSVHNINSRELLVWAGFRAGVALPPPPSPRSRPLAIRAWMAAAYLGNHQGVRPAPTTT